MARALLITAGALLAAAGAPHAIAAGGGVWEGKTSQGKTMELRLSRSGKLVKLVHTDYRLTCSDGGSSVQGFTLSQRAGDTITVAADGRYSTTGTLASGIPGRGSGSVTYRLRGRVGEARVTGVLRIDFTLDSGTTCTSGRVDYTLR